MNRDSGRIGQGDPFNESTLKKIRLMTYLLPLVGWIPALWTLYRHQGDRQQLSVSRLSVTLTLLWLMSYGLLWLGSLQTSEFLTLRLLYVNGLLTSGYILLCLGLIIRVFQGKPLWVPGMTTLSKTLEKK